MTYCHVDILSTVRIQNQKASPPKNIPLTLMSIKTMIAKIIFFSSSQSTKFKKLVPVRMKLKKEEMCIKLAAKRDYIKTTMF